MRWNINKTVSHSHRAQILIVLSLHITLLVHRSNFPCDWLGIFTTGNFCEFCDFVTTKLFYKRIIILLACAHISYHRTTLVRPHKIIFLFPVPARITFGERIKKNFIFYFIEFDVFVANINYFSVKAELFCPLFNQNTFLSDFTI